MLAACGSGAAATPAPTLTPEQQAGEQVFQANCAACHATVPNTVIVGPSLAGVATRAETRVPGQDAITYLQTSILKPYAYVVDGFPKAMPPDFGKRLTGEEFDEVVAYLLTLK